jgi:hypothetical protein
MHRVRQSLPYFRRFGWDPVVLTVEPRFVEGYRDELLIATVPDDIELHRVEALDPEWTRKVGLGSVALRSMWHCWKKGNELLAHGDIDLVYFSTTAFPLPVLGRYWKSRFGVPYVIDMQDPWHSDYYLDKPREERPPKFWLSYQMHRLLEPIAMREVDGLIAVTEAYNEDLTQRYGDMDLAATAVIPFGVSEWDYRVVEEHPIDLGFFPRTAPGEIRGVYTGVCNPPMLPTIRALFAALREGLDRDPDTFGRVRLYFVGTNYKQDAQPVVLLLAREYGVEGHVFEKPERIPYMGALQIQKDCDFLLLIGTADAQYTASKLYPYIFAHRPILAVFSAGSSVVEVMEATGSGEAVTFRGIPDAALSARILVAWRRMIGRMPYTPATDWHAFEEYTAESMTRKQVDVFDRVLRRQRARRAPAKALSRT